MIGINPVYHVHIEHWFVIGRYMLKHMHSGLNTVGPRYRHEDYHHIFLCSILTIPLLRYSHAIMIISKCAMTVHLFVQPIIFQRMPLFIFFFALQASSISEEYQQQQKSATKVLMEYSWSTFCTRAEIHENLFVVIFHKEHQCVKSPTTEFFSLNFREGA